MEFNGNINFLAALLDGLPTPERSERLEVKNDHSSTAQAQNIHRGAASLSANYNLSHRMRSPLNRVATFWMKFQNPCGSKPFLSGHAYSILRSERLEL